MPEICRFLGIVIYMYVDDHAPPHFHAVYAEYEGVFAIKNLEMIKGKLPPRVVAFITEWAIIHKEELEREWELAMAKKPLFKIDPLV